MKLSKDDIFYIVPYEEDDVEQYPKAIPVGRLRMAIKELKNHVTTDDEGYLHHNHLCTRINEIFGEVLK